MPLGSVQINVGKSLDRIVLILFIGFSQFSKIKIIDG